MAKKNQQYFVLLAIVVVVVVVIALFRTKHAAQAPGSSEQAGQQQSQQTSGQSATGAADASVWMGVLKTSNNPGSGNLMLVTKDRTIYIKTSRDYSALIGKNVRVSYEGTWQSFVLGDITLDEQQ